MKNATIKKLIVLFVFFLIPALGTSPVHAKQIKLTYSIFFPATHDQCKAGVAWAEEIESRSKGQVQISVFPGGTLTKANNCYSGVVSGISDIGMSCFAYTRGRFPVMEAVDLPLGYKSGAVATTVANAFYNTVKPKELDDVKVLYLHAHGPGLLHTQKPVSTLSDLKQMKIRSTGLSAKVVEALGGVPVAMPQGSTYEALQKGVVEGTFGPVEVLKGWRQAEVIKSTTQCAAVGYTTAMFVVMNKNTWNALPKNIQTLFTNVSQQWIDTHGQAWDSGDQQGREFSKKLGNDFVTLSQEEENKWVEAVQPVIDTYINKASAQGIDASANVKTLRDLIKKQ